MDPDTLKKVLKELEDAIDTPNKIKDVLKRYIPYYQDNQ
jgi:hypothetical protein